MNPQPTPFRASLSSNNMSELLAARRPSIKVQSADEQAQAALCWCNSVLESNLFFVLCSLLDRGSQCLNFIEIGKKIDRLDTDEFLSVFPEFAAILTGNASKR